MTRDTALSSPSSIRRLASVFAALCLSVLLSACADDSAWQLKATDGLLPDLEFRLINDQGETVTAKDYRGHVVMVYFGYTHCPDVCPTTLGKVKGALNRMDGEADDVRVLFVTVDPKRDTVARLNDYVGYFGPQFVGLRGGDEALEDLAKRYRVTYEAETPDAEDDYTVAHSNGVFIFDERGEARLLATRSHSAETIAADLERLLSQEAG